MYIKADVHLLYFMDPLYMMADVHMLYFMADVYLLYIIADIHLLHFMDPLYIMADVHLLYFTLSKISGPLSSTAETADDLTLFIYFATLSLAALSTRQIARSFSTTRHDVVHLIYRRVGAKADDC
jgi:hypothetical protein